MLECMALGLGVYDAFWRRDHVYLQPYNSYHPPLPMTSREVLAQLSYELPI